MKHSTPPPVKKILWLGDLHLDRIDHDLREQFLKKLNQMEYDAAVITGDTSDGRQLANHLAQLANASASRPVYFCLGNHDYYSSSFKAVHDMAESVCKRHDNLHFLGNGEIIRLTDSTALVGHGGWANGHTGWGRNTLVKSRDHHSIGDFRDLPRYDIFIRMNQLGKESAGYFRRVMPYALSRFSNLIICTHAPPFPEASQFDRKVCGWTHLPHFCNLAAGKAIAGITKNHPNRRVTVVCGHTHCSARVDILDNLRVYVGGAKRGCPEIQGILDVN